MSVKNVNGVPSVMVIIVKNVGMNKDTKGVAPRQLTKGGAK